MFYSKLLHFFQLTDLPVSLHHLSRLRFLDIKNNPLEAKLQAIVGDCLTKKECEAAAKKLIAHFTKQKQLAIEEEIAANKEKGLIMVNRYCLHIQNNLQTVNSKWWLSM